MSKALLSRIKPLSKSGAKPSPSSNFLFRPHIKKLINETIQILKTHEQWEHSLETRFSECDILVSDVTHFVLDRIDDAELGLKFFDWASNRSHYCSLNGFAYSSLLKLLARFRVFSEIKTVLETMRSEEIEPTREALSKILRAYADFGLVEKALEFYYVVIKVHNCSPDIFACNSLINVLVKHKKVETAYQVYDEMLKRDDGEASCADNYSTCIIMRGLCEEGRVEEGRKLIEARWGEGCIPNIVFYNTLIDGFCQKGDIESADLLFKELKLKGFLPTLETYGAIINGFCKKGEFEVIDKLLMEMNEMSLSVNVQVYNNIIDAQCTLGNMVKVKETIRKMAENGCEPDIATYNTLIKFSCRDGKVKEAYQLLEQAIKRGLMPNKFSYTPLVHTYCTQGDYIRASDLLLEMTRKGHNTDLVSYGALIHGLVIAGEVDLALIIRNKMLEKGVLPDAAVYNVLMSGLCKKGKLSNAKFLLTEMLNQNILPDAFVYATLVDGFVRNGDHVEAKELFELAIEKGIDPGVVGYNTMIKAFCKTRMMKDALVCVNRMRIKHNHVPDQFTYSTIIDGYVKHSDLTAALTMFGQMLKQSCKPNVVTYTSLINGYCKKGDFNRAEKTFREMQLCGLEANVVTYTILIGSFCKEGKLAKAASLFEQMLIKKCIPNNVTFHYLVNGFSISVPFALAGKANQREENDKSIFLDFFGRMVSDGWAKEFAVHNCILICLCQHGMVKTALELRDKMTNMGGFPDSVSFATLLHGICLEGKSKEWENIISCKLNKEELHIAIKYSLQLDQYLCKGGTSDASLILQTMLEGYRPLGPDHDMDVLKESSR